MERQVNDELRSLIRGSITKCWKQQLDDVEILLSIIRSHSLPGEVIIQLDSVYAKLRKRTLDTANDEIRKIDRVIGTLKIEKFPHSDIVFFS